MHFGFDTCYRTKHYFVSIHLQTLFTVCCACGLLVFTRLQKKEEERNEVLDQCFDALGNGTRFRSESIIFKFSFTDACI